MQKQISRSTLDIKSTCRSALEIKHFAALLVYTQQFDHSPRVIVLISWLEVMRAPTCVYPRVCRAPPVFHLL